MKNVLPSKLLASLYYSLVCSYLGYGISLLGATHDKHVNKINVIKKQLD